MTKNEVLDAMAHEWGLEDTYTVYGFWMAEHGFSVKALADYKKMVDEIHEADEYGFND